MNELIYEEVVINGQLFFAYDLMDTSNSEFGTIEKYVPSLNFELLDDEMSLLRYIVSNSVSTNIDPLKKLIRFVSHMLWFRSLGENRYIGYKSESSDYYNFIFEKDNLAQFQDFLAQAGINEQLEVQDTPTGKILYFRKNRLLPFFKVASNGTQALYTFFYWTKTSKDLSFLFIDEFDAYYHVELAETIVKTLEQQSSFQTVLTSHNTNLLSNRIMRPDCYFILTPERIVSFANATDRELREGHNLQKLYMSGEFDG